MEAWKDAFGTALFDGGGTKGPGIDRRQGRPAGLCILSCNKPRQHDALAILTPELPRLGGDQFHPAVTALRVGLIVQGSTANGLGPAPLMRRAGVNIFFVMAAPMGDRQHGCTLAGGE